MKDNNNSKRRYYQNKKLQSRTHSGTINLDPNNIINLKKLANDKYEQRNKNMKSNKSGIFTKLNIKNDKINLLNEYEDDLIDEKKNELDSHPKKTFHKKNNHSKDLNNDDDNSPLNYSQLNKSKIKNKRRKYRRINTNHEYINSFQNNDKSHDYIIGDFSKISKDFEKPKYSTKTNVINNNNNKSYDFKNDKNAQKSYREQKPIPVIVVSKKNYNFGNSAYNYFKKKESIIKIQSAWRGYFLRKIAVGSIKKYIGFIALIKYLDKVYLNNIHDLFEEFILLIKSYEIEKKKQLVYRKINYREIKLKNSNHKKRHLRKNNFEKDNNNDYLGYNSTKNNMLKNIEYEPIRDKSEDNIKNKRKRKNFNHKVIKTSFENNDRIIEENEMFYYKKKMTPNKYNKINRNLRISHFNNDSEIFDDISNSPRNILYIPKKVNISKSFRGINKKKEKKEKIEILFNIIKSKYYHEYYPFVYYKLKIL